MRAPLSVSLTAILLSLSGGGQTADAQSVRGVLFFSPTCQHCHQVITQYLPVLFENFGGAPRVSVDPAIPDAERALFLFHNDQLEILLIDASKPVGTDLYQASTINQLVPPERAGVPRMVIGDVVMVGSLEIPTQTDSLVRQGLEQGGLAWPSVDGLIESLAGIPAASTVVETQSEDSVEVTDSIDNVATDVDMDVESDTSSAEDVPVDTPAPAADSSVDSTAFVAAPSDAPALEPESDTGADTGRAERAGEEAEPDSLSQGPSVFDAIQPEEMSMLERFRLDPVGNSFSVAVLLIMIVCIVLVVGKPSVLPRDSGLSLAVPILTVVGAAVASYLTYIEATGTTAVCGPVGDCNTVNQSEYARLFGILPVGALGLMGYVAILAAWFAALHTSGKVSVWMRFSLLAMTFGGTLFSIYLTFLEPFVLGATCAWCLTSSVIITVLMCITSGSGRAAWSRIRTGVT